MKLNWFTEELIDLDALREELAYPKTFLKNLLWFRLMFPIIGALAAIFLKKSMD